MPVGLEKNKSIMTEYEYRVADKSISIYLPQQQRGKVYMYGATGQLLVKEEYDQQLINVNIATIPDGLCVLIFESGQQSFTKKIFVQHQ